MNKTKRVAILIFTLVFTLTAATGVAFADIDYSQWNSQSSYPPDVVGTPLFTPVKVLIDKKILTGYSDGTFKPENNITRAEIAVALTKMTNRTSQLKAAESKNIFSDLTGYGWAKGSINVMVDAGVIKGITASTYAPAKNISYAELITMLIRTKGSAASELEAYGTWPSNYIQYAQMYNMLGDVLITNWNAPATRGDTAKLIYRNMPKSSTTAGNAVLSATSISAAGGAAYLSVLPGTGEATTTYQWYKNGLPLAGETLNILSIPVPVAGDKYFVVVKTKKTGYSETTVTSDTCTIVP